MKCQKCGSKLRFNAKYCDECGAAVQLDNEVSLPREKKKTIKQIIEEKALIIFIILLPIAILLIVLIVVSFISNSSNSDSVYELSEKQKTAATHGETIQEDYSKFLEKQNNALSEIQTIQSDYQYYNELQAELDTIVESDGTIKPGCEGRAYYIVKELREATGLDIEIIDNKVVIVK